MENPSKNQKKPSQVFSRQVIVGGFPGGEEMHFFSVTFLLESFRWPQYPYSPQVAWGVFFVNPPRDETYGLSLGFWDIWRSQQEIYKIQESREEIIAKK